MKTGSLRLFLYGILLIAIQIVLLRHLQIFGATADLVLVYIVWLCIRRDKTLCLIYATIFGLLTDAYTDLWGLHMFSKTLLVFILHGYLNRIKEKQLLLWQVLAILFLSALLHNTIFAGVTIFSDLYSTGFLYMQFILYSSIYTAILGSLLHLSLEGRIQ